MWEDSGEERRADSAWFNKTDEVNTKPEREGGRESQFFARNSTDEKRKEWKEKRDASSFTSSLLLFVQTHLTSSQNPRHFPHNLFKLPSFILPPLKNPTNVPPKVIPLVPLAGHDDGKRLNLVRPGGDGDELIA